jgi:RNA-directed DNA polymerase
MNQITACAPPAGNVDWNQMDWFRCHANVRRLQARIVKATQEGRWGKVKSLQYLLTHSFSGKVLAVKRVTENKGKNTPGVDRATWTTPEAKSQAVLSLSRRGYKPKPLRRVYIPKRSGKMRPLGIPTMRDRAMEALHLSALYPIAETKADPHSYGFRPERSTADAIDRCFNTLSKADCAEWILEGDIKGCFDNISHNWLITNVPMDKVILRKWLKAGFIDRKKLFPTEAGTPQGGVISPTLANMTLDGLEPVLTKKFVRRNWNRQKVNLVRYADDFIITGASKEVLENEVKPLVGQFLTERGLSLAAEKTKVTHIEEGFEFLGFNLRKYKGKLLIKPAKENIHSFLQEIRRIVKGNKTAKQVSLIEMLNPLIKGWANYYQHVVASKTFNRMDHEIWKTLWQWAKRRHPNKAIHWIKEKYFRSMNGRDWVFADETDEGSSEGTPKLMVLRRLSETKIQRHIQIRSEANPFDPQWETYFEERMVRKMEDTLKGRKKLLKIWMDQEGKCPVCRLNITEETEWHNHHLLPRYKGGKDIMSNLVLLHPDCHRKVHSLKLEVVKPVPAKGLKKA